MCINNTNQFLKIELIVAEMSEILLLYYSEILQTSNFHFICLNRIQLSYKYLQYVRN